MVDITSAERNHGQRVFRSIGSTIFPFRKTQFQFLSSGPFAVQSTALRMPNGANTFS